MIQRYFRYFREMKLNPNQGMFTFILHRVTGIILVIYLFIHLWSLSHAFEGAEALKNAFELYNTTLFHIGEYLLLLCILIHGLNGLRLLLIDFLPITSKQRDLWWFFFIIFLIIAVASLFWFLPELPYSFIQAR